MRVRVVLLAGALIAGLTAAACGSVPGAPMSLARTATPSRYPTRVPPRTPLPSRTPLPEIQRASTPSPTTSVQQAAPVAPTPQEQPTTAPPTITPTESPAPAAGPVVTVTSETANVRSGPGLQYPVVGRARRGERLAITGQLAGGGWWRVDLSGKPGWIAASVVSASAEAAVAPVMTQEPAAPVEGSKPAAPATATQAAPRAPAAAGGGRIAFASGRGDVSDVALLDVATGNVSIVASNGRQPDIFQGGMIVFKGSGGGRDNLFTVWQDGSHLTEISSHGEDSYPQWAPIKQAIVYYSTSAGSEQIFVQWDTTGIPEDDTSLQVDVHGGPRPVDGRYATWVNDRRIAYVGCDIWARSGDCGIWTIDADNWEKFVPFQLSRDTGARPSDSYGEMLLYSSAASGNWEVYAASAALPSKPGNPKPTPRNLTNDAAQDVGATFSPDGKRIAFISNRGGAWGIWVAEADGRNPRLLAAVPQGFGPHWDEERLSWGR
jgi:uncharacterized protein YraI